MEGSQQEKGERRRPSVYSQRRDMFVMFHMRWGGFSNFPFHCLEFNSNCQAEAKCGTADVRPEKVRQAEHVTELRLM